MKNILAIAMMVCFSAVAVGQTEKPSPANDTTELEKRKQALELKKSTLEYELKKVQDDKSYMQYGVAPEQVEKLQIANDSIQLELKSQILVTRIEIQEINRDIAEENLLQNANVQQLLNKPPKKPNKK